MGKYIFAEDVLTGSHTACGWHSNHRYQINSTLPGILEPLLENASDGTVVFVVVDGRLPEAAGVSTTELSLIMSWLGCRDALNLDGGGSSTMVFDGNVVNHPSDNKKFDHQGERVVANAIVVRDACYKVRVSSGF